MRFKLWRRRFAFDIGLFGSFTYEFVQIGLVLWVFEITWGRRDG